MENTVINYAFKLAKKDIIIEFRRAHEIISIIAFALTSVLLSSFAWRSLLVLNTEVVSAMLWTVIYFSSILSLTTSFSREVDRGTIEGLRSLPCPAYTILIGKIIYGFAIIFTVLLATILSANIFLNISLALLPGLIIVFTMGVLDLAVIGSIVSAIVMYSEGKTLLLSFLFFPISVPILIPGTLAVSKLISGTGLYGILQELRLLSSFLLGVSAVSILLFRYVFNE